MSYHIGSWILGPRSLEQPSKRRFRQVDDGSGSAWVTPSTRKTRESRPGQLPPIHSRAGPRENTAGSNDLESNLPWDDGDEADYYHQDVGSSQVCRGDWSQRMQQLDQSWDAKIPCFKKAYIDCFPMSRALYETLGRRRLQMLQDNINEGWMLHPCCSHESTISDECLTLLEKRPTKYVGHSYVGSLEIPRWHCSSCKQDVDSDPLAWGCFPSTPTAPAIWYDQQVMLQYKTLIQHGCSATGTVTCYAHLL